ncbi:MAG: DUF2249 domain-containing protein [Candidatus Methylomirabilales bacterium]
MAKTVTLDVRSIPVQEKHPTVFRTFEALGPGDTLLLINDHDPKPLYYQFAFERQGEFEWRYVEAGPTVWRVEITKAAGHRHEPIERATEALKHDHRVIERVLGVLERALFRLEQGGAAERELFGKALEFFRGFADSCHHHKEEQVLFPRLAERGIPVEGGPVGVMLYEHEEGRRYLRGLAEGVALLDRDPERARQLILENGKGYSGLLRAHIQKEDQVLFPLADGVLTPGEQRELIHRFEEVEHHLGEGVHERFMHLAEELERRAEAA